jgi:hypothetical protein
MLFNFSKIFKKNARERKLTKLLRNLENTPNNANLTLCIAHNKELCEIEPFIKLLNTFQYFPIEGYQLQQNINSNIISFRETIYDTCLTVSKIYKNLLEKNIYQVSFVARIARMINPSYKFFNEKPDQFDTTFDQQSLDQLVGWMREIIVYFDNHKTSQDNFEEAFCSVTYQNMDVLYDFFYCLLCHIVNIRCDHQKRICVFLEEDI